MDVEDVPRPSVQIHNIGLEVGAVANDREASPQGEPGMNLDVRAVTRVRELGLNSLCGLVLQCEPGEVWHSA